jgi:leukotriene-A4 hydrolase
MDARVLTQIGRMKFIRPLYNGINRLDHDQALSLFAKNKHLYHPIAVTQISKDIDAPA